MKTELKMDNQDLVKEIDENKERYGIISYEINNKSISAKTKPGYSQHAIRYIAFLTDQFPDLVKGGNAIDN